MLVFDLNCGEIELRQDRGDCGGRPKILPIDRPRLREVFVIQPVWTLLRAHVVKNESSARPQQPECLGQHAEFIGEMMKGELAADVIECFTDEWHRGGVALHEYN